MVNLLSQVQGIPCSKVKLLGHQAIFIHFLCYTFVGVITVKDNIVIIIRLVPFIFAHYRERLQHIIFYTTRNQALPYPATDSFACRFLFFYLWKYFEKAGAFTTNFGGNRMGIYNKEAVACKANYEDQWLTGVDGNAKIFLR